MDSIREIPHSGQLCFDFSEIGTATERFRRRRSSRDMCSSETTICWPVSRLKHSAHLDGSTPTLLSSETLSNDPNKNETFGYLNLWNHMEEFSRGVVDTRRIVYYLSATAFFLYLTVVSLSTKKESP